jgi:peptidyl-dipeptidase A
VIDVKGKLPASVLSDMWGRFWGQLYKDVIPYPAKPNLDVSKNMKFQNYTATKIFKTADNFFAGMGLIRVPDTFWNVSMLEKPKDGRNVVCHPTAWDFYDGKVRNVIIHSI